MTVASLEDTNSLPIIGQRDAILQSVDTNQVTIITAETGAGKSTQVPQYLADHGYKKIIVTQPRILAARNLCLRVREEYSWHHGKDCTSLVGYRTANERDDNTENVILYCTDGLQLVRELTGSGTNDRQVLVLDEIHEWNENMEVLVAWAKKRCLEDPHFKVVLMSATIEANDLASYFGSGEPINVAGRSYEVEQRQGGDLVDEILEQAKTRSSNMLVFLPGKPEIERVGELLEATLSNNMPVIPLHSQLTAEEQQKAFESYPNGKIILTTNIAQTSVTIDDIDVVIDSGLERRAEVRNNVEGLFIEQTSQADCLQRAGRAGRTKAGLYILAKYDTLPCLPFAERPQYGVPEIMRKHIDRLVLRLSSINIDVEELEFYHAPSHRTIKLAKQTLKSLGALTQTGEITAIGRSMERFPVESSYARMLVQAADYNAGLQAQLASIIAIQEVGGIVKGGPRYSGWRRFTSQTRSDLVAQYDVYLALPNIAAETFEELGIIDKNVLKAEETRGRLLRDLNLEETLPVAVAETDIDQLLKCIVAGQLHQLWLAQPPGSDVINIASGKVRELSSTTVVKQANLIAGTPFDLEIHTAKGLDTFHLVNDITAVNPVWLTELAPELYKVRLGTIYFEPKTGTLATKTIVTFNKNEFEAAGPPLVERTTENKRLFLTLYSKFLFEQLERERAELKSRSHKKIPEVSYRHIQDKVAAIAGHAVSLFDVNKQQRVELRKLGFLETHIGREYMETLQQSARHRPSFFKSKGWKPPHKRKYNRRRD